MVDRRESADGGAREPWMPRDRWDALVRGEGCPLCLDLGDAAPNAFRYVVAELSVSMLWLSRNQSVPGYCVVVARRHAREPHELEPGERAAFFEDMVRAGRALEEAFGAVKINYEVLGNAVPHLHAHVKPRFYGDPAPGRPIHPDAHVVHLADDEYAERIRLIRAALGVQDSASD